MGNANDKQIGGSHYKSTHECWDYIIANNLGYLEGTAIKYLTRWRKKNGVEDLQKAVHFIQKLIEVEESKFVSKETPTLDRFPLVSDFDKCASLSMVAPKRTVGGLRRTDSMASEAGNSVPIYSGELNEITIIREDKCSTQTKSS